MAAVERRRGYHPNHESMALFLMDPSKTGKIAMEAARTVARRAKLLVELELDRDDSERQNDDAEAEDSNGKGLADSFEVRQTVVVLNENPPNPRLASVVVNQKRHAARWEFGASPGHREAHRSLRRAGASVGQLRGEIG